MRLSVKKKFLFSWSTHMRKNWKKREQMKLTSYQKVVLVLDAADIRPDHFKDKEIVEFDKYQKLVAL